jgi:predicted dehydrogenase
MQNRRFLKGTAGYKNIMESGSLGKIGLVSTDFFINPGYGSFRDQVLTHALLTDMAVHTFDMVRYMFGAEPLTVYCHGFSPPGLWFKGAPAAICIFEMTGGLVFNYRGYWSSRTLMTTWEGTWRADGSKGTAIWNEKNEQFCEILKYDDIRMGNEKELIYPANEWDGLVWHSGCLENMFNALAASKKPMTDCTDNIKSIAMVFAAIKSSEEKIKVEVVYA